jgi:hypothetical protein
MKCPFCENEMETGFVASSNNGLLCWINSKPTGIKGVRYIEGFTQISDYNYLKSPSTQAHRCQICGKIIIDYTAKEP